MKKQIISLAIAAFALTSFTSVAQNPASAATKNCTNKECAATKGNKDSKRPAYNPFEGLNLSADQQAKLDALQAEQKAARDAKRTADKTKKQEARNAQKEAKKAERKAQLDKIKAILTPEQYVTFLENQYLTGHGASKAAKPGKQGKQGKQRAGKQGKQAKQRPAAQQSK